MWSFSINIICWIFNPSWGSYILIWLLFYKKGLFIYTLMSRWWHNVVKLWSIYTTKCATYVVIKHTYYSCVLYVNLAWLFNKLNMNSKTLVHMYVQKLVYIHTCATFVLFSYYIHIFIYMCYTCVGFFQMYFIRYFTTWDTCEKKNLAIIHVCKWLYLFMP